MINSFERGLIRDEWKNMHNIRYILLLIMIVATIIRDGEIIAAAQEERFTRIKHDSFSQLSQSNLLAVSLDLSEIQVIFMKSHLLNLKDY